VIDGVVTINGEKLFALQFLQARNPDWVRRPFFAKYDPDATWLDHLKPAFGRKKFFFEAGEGEAGLHEGDAHAAAGRVIPIQPARQHDKRASDTQPDAA
jgi:hypothetical protein